ncbi:MAG: spondin domain-containing protein [Pseudomonadota bacterium]
MKSSLIPILLTGTLLLGLNNASANDNRFPYCEFGAASDSDGDGYGWENDATCLVRSAQTFTVKVRNLTYQQVLSPIIAVAHDKTVALLEAGMPASEGLTAIAEGGDTSVLAAALDGVSAVSGVATSAGPVPPATEVSFELEGSDYISVASMLVNTNDALMIVDTIALPENSGDYIKYYATSWDAGTETNDEMCHNIPGPACGGSGASPDDDGEGFVHIHRGLQGVGDLDAAANAWTDPVAVVTVIRN